MPTGIYFNIPSTIILLGAILAIWLAVFLSIKKPKRSRNIYLIGLLVAIGYHLFEYAMAFSANTLLYPHLVATSYPLLFTIAPLLYLHIGKSFGQRIGLKSLWHFLPSLLCLLSFLPFYMMPATEKVEVLKSVETVDGFEVPAEQMAMMLAQMLQMLIYSWLSVKKANAQNAILKQRLSNGSLLHLGWLITISKAFFGISLLFLITNALAFSFQKNSVAIDYITVLTVAILVFGLAFTAIAQPKLFMASPLANGKMNGDQPLSEDENLWKRIQDFMRDEKPYLEEELRIELLADKIGLPYYKLSTLINQEYKGSFFEFVNFYRVEHAKELLADGTQNDLKILAVAMESGFSNKATFNRVFKNHTNTTPSVFRKTAQKSK